LRFDHFANHDLWEDSGVGSQHIEPAETIDDPGDHVRAGILGGQVDLIECGTEFSGSGFARATSMPAMTTWAPAPRRVSAIPRPIPAAAH